MCNDSSPPKYGQCRSCRVPPSTSFIVYNLPVPTSLYCLPWQPNFRYEEDCRTWTILVNQLYSGVTYSKTSSICNETIQVN